ncbi:unnamed protein product [Effrenium voratum]|nr:unnamed protein product [Effrenium voratum]
MRELLESRESRPPPTPPKAPHTREPTPRLPPTRGSLTGGRPEPFPNLPRSSLQLVEKTKEDEKNFKIWSVGGRANTPLSFWVEDKVAPQPMAQTWRSEREARRPVRGHVRSLLAPLEASDGGARFPQLQAMQPESAALPSLLPARHQQHKPVLRMGFYSVD